MITVGEAVVLGLVQGLTELLPVSSSGHLAIAHRFVTLAPEEALALDGALRLGTLGAVVAYFWADLWGMLRNVGSPRRGGWRFRWGWLLLLASVPALAIGIPFKHVIDESLLSMPTVGLGFVLSGAFLYLASAVRGALRREDSLANPDALVIGCFQVVALLPGISRAGMTIAGGIFRQLRGDVAVRFACLLAIPVAIGAELGESGALHAIGRAVQPPLLWGVVASALAGIAAIWILFRVIQAERLHYFAYYLWTLGALVLVGTTVFGL